VVLKRALQHTLSSRRIASGFVQSHKRRHRSWRVRKLLDGVNALGSFREVPLRDQHMRQPKSATDTEVALSFSRRRDWLENRAP